ncbi:MAG TPA: 6-phosphofructokinase [Blastocatellia bacterium]|nr:6-phosphofructokinase [Blastocatellia bacterium]
MSIKQIGVLVGGGPAPGINGVIAAAATEAINRGCSVIGIHDGFEWISQRFTDEQHRLSANEVSNIHMDGGSILGTSRFDVSSNNESLQNAVRALRKLNIDALIAIGGDDLVRSAVAIEEASKGEIKVVLIPKTVDNDLWMPLPVPTLGYETAREVGVELVQNLMVDAKTTGRWYFGVIMGRPTGHLTLGIGKAASATCTIIPEEFPQNPICLDDVADVVEGTIIKRLALGKSYGVVLLAEALSEHLSPSEVSELQTVDRDAQGNIRVTEIDLGRKIKSDVQSRFEKRGIKITIVDKTIGYELRCAPPNPFDSEYARDLGYAAVNYLLSGGSQSLITVQGGDFLPVPLTEIIDPVTGRGRQRPVDVNTESYKVARDYMVRLNSKDLANESFAKQLAQVGKISLEDLAGTLNRQGHMC